MHEAAESARPAQVLPGNAQALGQRAEQQDAFAFSDLGDAEVCARSGALCVLCDGMGGHAAGGEAARAAVAGFLDHYQHRPPGEAIARSLERALQAANDAVLDVAARAGDSGATLVAAVVHDGWLRWISVGDSRLMLLRDGRLHRVNREHRHRATLLRLAAGHAQGWAEARDDPSGEHLVASLGEDPLSAVDRSRRPWPLAPGDRVVLASDGLYRSVDEAALLAAAAAVDARGEATPQALCSAWVELALAAGQPEQDNVTVAAMAWGGPEVAEVATVPGVPAGAPAAHRFDTADTQVGPGRGLAVSAALADLAPPRPRAARRRAVTAAAAAGGAVAAAAALWSSRPSPDADHTARQPERPAAVTAAASVAAPAASSRRSSARTSPAGGAASGPARSASSGAAAPRGGTAGRP
jgi:protein phosphatase